MSQPTPVVSIVVVDDSRVHREGVAELLARQPWVDQVHTAADEATALSRALLAPRAVMLLNMAAEHSLEWLKTLAKAQARVVTIGVRDREDDILICAEAGSAGYVLRADSLESLRSVVEAVARGETVCSPRTTSLLLGRVAALAAEREAKTGPARLTAREAEILELVEQGFANREIAERLSIEVRTVKNHVHSILVKIGVTRRGQAAAWARTRRRPVLVPGDGEV